MGLLSGQRPPQLQGHLGAPYDCGRVAGGLAAYAWGMYIKRTDDKRASICGETLVRLFVQADSRNEADDVLEVMGKLSQNAHDRHPNPPLVRTAAGLGRSQALLSTHSSKEVSHADQLPEIRWFASEALICAGTRRVVSELVQWSQRNQINRAGCDSPHRSPRRSPSGAVS